MAYGRIIVTGGGRRGILNTCRLEAGQILKQKEKDGEEKDHGKKKKG